MKIQLYVAVWLCSLIIFAQESEIKEAQKKLDSKDFSGAISIINTVENTYDVKTIDPNLLNDMYYTKGLSFLAQNNILDGSKALLKVKKIEESPFFMVKIKESKEKFYFSDETEANEFAAQNDTKAKSYPVEKKYTTNVLFTLNSKLDDSQKMANKLYTDKNYSSASQKFLETYYITEALDLDGKMYLYYAAISSYQGKDFEKADELFDEVIQLQYEGTNPEDNTLESAYKLKAYIASDAQDWNQVIENSKKGLEKFPDNQDLNTLLSRAYNETGNNEAFINQLKGNLEKNPNDALNNYNLGVLYYQKENGKDEALIYFFKAAENKPDYSEAYNNIARILIDKDKEYNLAIDELGGTSKDAEKEDQIEAQRKSLYLRTLPILEKAHAQFPEEKLYVQLLKIGYGIVKDESNYKKYEALLRAM